MVRSLGIREVVPRAGDEGALRDCPKAKQIHKPRRRRSSVFCRLPEKRKQEAMIARFEQHLILMEIALATVVCVVLVAVPLIVVALMGPPSVPSVDLNAAPSHSQIVHTMQY
jgi:hypothetical protein